MNSVPSTKDGVQESDRDKPFWRLIEVESAFALHMLREQQPFDFRRYLA